jgi:hypothetical protein
VEPRTGGARRRAYDRAVRVALLITFYGLVAAIAGLFMGTSVPPCFGRVPDGRMSQACIDHWLANRGLVERLFSTSWTPVAAFLLASALTIWWFRRQPRGSGRAR